MTEKQEQHISSLHVVLMGHAQSGKTQFLNRYIDHGFDEKYKPTKGVDFKRKTIKDEYNHINLILWDITGHERFRPTELVSYYNRASAVILFIDPTQNLDEQLNQFIPEINKYVASEIPVIIVLSKSDLNAQVTQEKLESKLKNFSFNLKSIQSCSAKDNIHIDTIGNALVDMLQPSHKEKATVMEPPILISHHKLNKNTSKKDRDYTLSLIAGAVLGIALSATGAFAPFGMGALGIIALGVLGSVVFGVAMLIIKSCCHLRGYSERNQFFVGLKSNLQPNSQEIDSTKPFI